MIQHLLSLSTAEGFLYFEILWIASNRNKTNHPFKKMPWKEFEPEKHLHQPLPNNDRNVPSAPFPPMHPQRHSPVAVQWRIMSTTTIISHKAQQLDAFFCKNERVCTVQKRMKNDMWQSQEKKNRLLISLSLTAKKILTQ